MGPAHNSETSETISLLWSVWQVIPFPTYFYKQRLETSCEFQLFNISSIFHCSKTAYFTFISSAAATLLLELADGPDTLLLVIFIHYFFFLISSFLVPIVPGILGKNKGTKKFSINGGGKGHQSFNGNFVIRFRVHVIKSQ